MKSSAGQFGVIVQDEEGHRELVTNVGYRVLLSDVARRKRSNSGTSITIAMALIGLLAGWVAGIALTGGFRDSRSAAEPAVDVALPSPPQQVDAQSAEKSGVSANKPVRSREGRADYQESEDPDADKADDKPAETVVAPAPAREPSKEIGQAAMDKILKENEKIKRGKHLKANKNDE